MGRRRAPVDRARPGARVRSRRWCAECSSWRSSQGRPSPAHSSPRPCRTRRPRLPRAAPATCRELPCARARAVRATRSRTAPRARLTRPFARRRSIRRSALRLDVGGAPAGVGERAREVREHGGVRRRNEAGVTSTTISCRSSSAGPQRSAQPLARARLRAPHGYYNLTPRMNSSTSSSAWSATARCAWPARSS